MKKLLIPLLALVGLTAHPMGRTPPARPQPTNTATLDLATGNLTQIDNSGQSQSAAGNSRVANIDSGVAVEFAKKSDPGQELAWFDISRAAEDQPDVAIDLALANEHKSAVENLKSITAGGNPQVAALNLATEALKVVKTKIEAREREKAARGKADTSAFRATAFLQGPDAVKSVALMAGTLGSAVANGNQNRANYQSNINSSQIDTSNTNDYVGVNAALKTQLEMTRLELEIAKLKQAVTPAPKPPVVKPVDPKPDLPDTPEIPGQSPEARHKSLYPHVQLTGGNAGTATNHTLWKPGADQGADGLVVVTQHNLPKIRSLTILKGGETVKRMSIDDVVTAGNGYRLNWRFGGRGYSGAHTVVADTVDGQYSVEIPDGNKRNDGLQMKKSEVEPVDPPPSTSSLFILEPDKLTLRPDFAAAVRTIDVLTKINDPKVKGATNSVPSSVRVDAGLVGPLTWGIPKPLGSYPRGNMPNTWRIGLIPGKIPADVTYHKSIMQTFIQDGATKTFPPTTRE